MTEPLDPELKRVRKLSPGELADEVGAVKAQISDLEAKLDGYKADAIRRGLVEADGKLFRLAFSPLTPRLQLDGKLLRAVFGDPFVDHFSRSVMVDWVMRCSARKAA
jgi:hypothetical protein